MLDLSFLGQKTFLGRVLRAPIRRLIPDTAQVRILQGPSRGRRWIAGSSVAGCWLGFFEASKQTRIASYVRPGMVCFDIGANVGFYTLLFWSVTGPEGIVVAFEPLPENFALLGRHVEINGCGNVRIFPYAVADHDGMSRFERGQYNTNGRLSAKGDLLAQCYRLDTCMAEFNLAMPHVIKIDVEGAEADVLEGAANTIRASKPVIFVATHGEQPHRDCCRILTAAGYDLECLEGGPIELASEIVAIPRR